MPRRALARVNLAAIERNIVRLRAALSDGVEFCAVVKGDGYGHGAVAVARAAMDAGAGRLAVASSGEAAELRAAGVTGPVLVMGALSREELDEAVLARAEVVAWSSEFVAAAASAAGPEPLPIHVKLDTGMGRLGTRFESEALEVAERSAAAPELRLIGAMTHLATAGEDTKFVAEQLDRFEPFVQELRSRWPDLIVHAANSAATLTDSRSHFDLVRCGIAIYGCDPLNEDPVSQNLEPALEFTSYVAAVKAAKPGDSAGYGRTFVATEDTYIATVPIGYADGFRRGLGNNCDVLIGGRRYPVVGTVSMDNITVDVGREPQVRVDDPVVIIGSEPGERLTAEELGQRIGTINYEIVCGISKRVPRVYHRDGEPA